MILCVCAQGCGGPVFPFIAKGPDFLCGRLTSLKAKRHRGALMNSHAFSEFISS